MFESIRQGGCPNPMANVSSLFASVVVHAVVISLLVVVPMVFSRVLPQKPLMVALFPREAFPVSIIPLPPPFSVDRGSRHPAGEPPVSITRVPSTKIRIPDPMPYGIPAPDEEAVSFTGTFLFPVGSESSAAFGANVDGIRNTLTWADPGPVSPPKAPPVKAAPIRVGQLDPSKRLYKVDPVYPTLARLAHIEGDVRLEAVVDETGCIADVRVLDGPPLLVSAAVEAVRRWVYSPTIQNGEPVRIQAIITVRFRLNR
jgi:TonB family protein